MLTAKEAKRLAKDKDIRPILDAIKERALLGYYQYFLSGGLTEENRKALKNLGYKVIPTDNGFNIHWN